MVPESFFQGADKSCPIRNDQCLCTGEYPPISLRRQLGGFESMFTRILPCSQPRNLYPHAIKCVHKPRFEDMNFVRLNTLNDSLRVNNWIPLKVNFD